MRNTENKNRLFVIQAAVAVLLICVTVLSFVIFLRDNRVRIIDQNNSFIQAAAVQKAERISDLISASENRLRMIVDLYESVLDEPVIDSQVLKDMVELSQFDYVEFISPDGEDLTADGRTADLSDRDYFIEGMKGNSGMSVVRNSRITNETLLIFYSPFYYEDEIIGVLSCILTSDTLTDILESDYFGMQGSSYLLQRNGDVISTSGVSEVPDNLTDHLRDDGILSDDDLQKFEEALDSSNDIDYNVFNYQGIDGKGSAYITVIDGCELVLVQSFPSAVTRTMTKSAVSAGVRLAAMLFAVFAVYIVLLVIKNMHQKRRLVDEKQEVTSVLGAAIQLFSRFALVDFEKNEYEYLENKKSDAPESGSYDDLINYLTPLYVADDSDAEKMSEVITGDYVYEHLTQQVPYLRYEYCINMGGKHWENMSIICIKRRKGKPVKVLFAIQDVTSLKEREQEIRLALKNSSEAAEAANRAKSDFLARMSHDIRTPMNAIMGMTAVAAMHLDDKERLNDCLQKITTSSRHLLALINDVLDMSKIESGKVSLSEEPFNMADMVDSVVTIIKPQIKSRKQDLRVHINDIVHEDVIGDHLRLRQVFVNILGNAVKFTPEGGKVTFTIREIESHIRGMACFEFICEDTGIGMTPEFVKTIFEPFSRAKESAGVEGTGLGMSITRNIVRMMNGDISVESEPGVGSKFTVLVHLSLQEQGADGTEELADLRVLVTDDDRDSCITTCEILTGIGMKPEYVLTGEEAVEKVVSAQQSGEGYSAVILDWKMPGMDGVQTTKAIREKVGKEVPIIILSAYDWTDIEAEARDAGVDAFVEKPLFRSRIVYALKSIITDGFAERKNASVEDTNRFSGKRILLVEDNELNMEIAVELLTSYTGVEVETAENGRIAVEMFENSEENHFDLIFMDIQMPEMDGYEAARQIRKLGKLDSKSVPIIAMTANAFSDDIWKAHDAGMNDHISKPVEIEKLMNAMSKWLAEKTV